MSQKDRVKHKRRYCRIPECGKIVKSQGLCQRHGAKTRKCKVSGCEKQAQGNFDGMCKLHFKMTKTQLIAQPATEEEVKLGPVGESVYDRILPESIGWVDDSEAMPLVKHLKDGFDREKPRGWHRNEERRSRGLAPVTNPAIQLEGWERELVWMEICLLSGCPQSSFRHLARSWGRDKGFHMVLAQFICERRGNVERKKRVKGDQVTKKSRRAPVDLSPSGEELPHSFEEFDEVDLDGMLGVFGDHHHHSDFDPTVNFTHVPDFSHYRRNKKLRQPLDLCNAMPQQDAYDHDMLPAQDQQEQQQHGLQHGAPQQPQYMGHHHAIMQHQHLVTQMSPIPAMQMAPPPGMMSSKILAAAQRHHDALICEVSGPPPQQQRGMYDDTVPV